MERGLLTSVKEGQLPSFVRLAMCQALCLSFSPNYLFVFS